MRKQFIFILILILPSITMAHNYYEQIKTGTNGLGTFTVKITNNTPIKQSVSVRVGLQCSLPLIDPEKISLRSTNYVEIESSITETVLLLKPFVGSKMSPSLQDILDSYTNISARPELDSSCRVVVSIEYGTGHRLNHKIQTKTLAPPAVYVENTLFVEVPSNIEFVIEE